MAQGRGSAVDQARGIAVSLLALLLVHGAVVHATTYTVGDAGGWAFNAAPWTDGKTFRAGDVLSFNYNPEFHNVAVVDEASYNACSTPSGAKVYQTGNDQITLASGKIFFICNFPGHCESDMKIAVSVE